MKSYFLLVIIAIGIFFVSCKKQEEPPKKYRLTPEDLTWNIYHVGDTIKFLSNLSHYRSYCVEYINRYIENPGENDQWYSYEGISIKFNRADSGQTDHYFIMDFNRGYPSTSTFNVMIWLEDGLGMNYLSSLPSEPNVDTLTVNDSMYYNVYEDKNMSSNTADTVAKGLYYNKQKGWLRIELYSGEKLDRIN